MDAWKTIESRYILESPWLNLREDRIEAGAGQVVDPFYVVEYPDWSCVVALTADDHLLLVEQYRHGVERFSLELPAGAVDEGETPLEAARRELLEETGYEADDWMHLGSCAPEPSKHTNFAHIYLARDLRRAGEQELDSLETIRVHHVSLNKIGLLIDRGAVFHGVHLYALMLARSSRTATP